MRAWRWSRESRSAVKVRGRTPDEGYSMALYPQRNWTLRLQSQNAVLAALRTDRRQHAPTRFSSAPQCLLQRRRERLVGCDQLLAFGGRIDGNDRWAGLAVVVIPQNASPAHLVSTSRAELRSLLGGAGHLRPSVN